MLARAANAGFRSTASATVPGAQGERRVVNDVSVDEAMDRYAQGEHAAFSLLYAGLEGRLRAFLRRLTGDSTLADDLLQETFLRIHRARGGFASGGAVVPWAYAIARNAWLDDLRRAKSRPRPIANSTDKGSAGSLVESIQCAAADGEQLAIARQVAAQVEGALARLPNAQREAFVLLRYEGLSVAEAADVLGSSEGAVKLRAFRAYEALRAALYGQRADGGNDEIR